MVRPLRLVWLAFAIACGGGSTEPPGGGGGGPAPVATVQLSQTTLVLTVGDTLRLLATPRDSTGAALGRTVAWSSDASGIATVSTSGLVTAVAAGTANVSAASEGRSASAAVTVNAAAAATECGAPQAGWIWCDDFEQDRLASYFEYDNAGGNFTRVAAVGHNGSFGMRARYAAAAVSVGGLHLAIGKTPQAYIDPVDAGTQIYRDIYWRMYLRHQPGWQGGGGHKLSRAFVFASTTSFAQAMIAHVWAGSAPNQDYLYIEPASGTDVAGNLITTTYNDFANLRFLGPVKGTTPMFNSAGVGQWYCVEARARLNDPGLSNGVQELWVNGVLQASRTDLNFLGNFSAYGINAVYLENYWNAPGSPVLQERYMDRFVVSTQRIGC